LLGELERNHRFVVADLEAGLGTTLRLEQGAVDVALIVVEPTAKAIEVGLRIADAAADRARVVVIANKVRTGLDHERVATEFARHELFVVPEDTEVARADRAGLAPLDTAPDTPAVRALVELTDRLAPPPPGS
jgi:CO dehydrogenase nickel-insertion accessory protein CooC1